MFKKLMTLMIAVSIFTVQAHASTQDGLKAAFNELNYALTVEWDQKDTAFHEAEMKKFSAAIRDLKAQGLTNAQLLDFAKSEIKDAQIAKDLETTLNMIQINKMSSAEANKYLLDAMNKSYSAGANWNGTAVVFLAVGVLLIIGGALAISSPTYYGGNNSCYNRYVCQPYCYYDYYYNYICYQDCYYTCY